jgi:uncharacterized protein (DUF1697 family)
LRYVALFRGINVGNLLKISMTELKSIMENLGFSDVITYLNSGNVLFKSSKTKNDVSELIDNECEKRYKQKIAILIKTSQEIIKIAKSIPEDWNNDNTQQTYVAYLFKDIANPKIVDELPIKKEYMSIFYDNECLVWNIKKENYNKSHITKIASHDSYGRMTTRNSNTARKLAELCNIQF